MCRRNSTARPARLPARAQITPTIRCPRDHQGPTRGSVRRSAGQLVSSVGIRARVLAGRSTSGDTSRSGVLQSHALTSGNTDGLDELRDDAHGQDRTEAPHLPPGRRRSADAPAARRTAPTRPAARSRRKRISEYQTVWSKQKLRAIRRERGQMRRYYDRPARSKGRHRREMIGRLGDWRTPCPARVRADHPPGTPARLAGHVTLDGKRLNIPSAKVKPRQVEIAAGRKLRGGARGPRVTADAGSPLPATRTRSRARCPGPRAHRSCVPVQVEGA